MSPSLRHIKLETHDIFCNHDKTKLWESEVNQDFFLNKGILKSMLSKPKFVNPYARIDKIGFGDHSIDMLNKIIVSNLEYNNHCVAKPSNLISNSIIYKSPDPKCLSQCKLQAEIISMSLGLTDLQFCAKVKKVKVIGEKIKDKIVLDIDNCPDKENLLERCHNVHEVSKSLQKVYTKYLFNTTKHEKVNTTVSQLVDLSDLEEKNMQYNQIDNTIKSCFNNNNYYFPFNILNYSNLMIKVLFGAFILPIQLSMSENIIILKSYLDYWEFDIGFISIFNNHIIQQMSIIITSLTEFIFEYFSNEINYLSDFIFNKLVFLNYFISMLCNLFYYLINWHIIIIDLIDYFHNVLVNTSINLNLYEYQSYIYASILSLFFYRILYLSNMRISIQSLNHFIIQFNPNNHIINCFINLKQIIYNIFHNFINELRIIDNNYDN